MYRKNRIIIIRVKANETLLSKFRMQFAWTFVAFAGLKRGKFGSAEAQRKQSSDDHESTGTFNLLNDERASTGSMIIEDEDRSDFVPQNGTIDFSIKQVYKMDTDKLSDEQVCNQIVEVCRNPHRYKQKTINCDFSISLQSTADSYNIRSDDLHKLKPWKNEIKGTTGRIVREFPKQERIPRPLLNYRNVLFVFPKSVNLQAQGRARNIAIRIELRNEYDTISSIYGDELSLTKMFISSVSYHRSNPMFIDEVKFEIPEELLPDHHLFFTFYHVSVKEGNETLIGYSWMPMLDANHQIQNGTKNIPVCLLPPPPGYGRLGPDVNLPGVKWLDNRRALFKVHFEVDSNVHILDRQVHDFVKCCLAAESVKKNDTFSCVSGRRMPVEQLQEELCQSIRNLSQTASVKSIIKYLHIIMNRLVWLVVSPPLSDRIIIAQCAFNTMVNVVDRLHADPSLPSDGNGRCLYLEQYMYYIVREDISESCTVDPGTTLGRQEWIRHTMNSRDRKNTKEASRIVRHSSYSDSPKRERINPSSSDPELTPKKIAPTITSSQSAIPINDVTKEEVARPVHEELSFQMVVCPNGHKERDIFYY